MIEAQRFGYHILQDATKTKKTQKNSVAINCLASSIVEGPRQVVYTDNTGTLRQP